MRRMYRKLVTPLLINVEARRRNITRLCHFTSIESLPGILADRNIWSVKRATQYGCQMARNDTKRHDNRLNHISVSVQYPNLYLLDSYRRTGTRGWVILLLDSGLLSRCNTLFCPVNAATKSGHLVKRGLRGFRGMLKPVSAGRSGSRRIGKDTPIHKAPPQGRGLAQSTEAVGGIYNPSIAPIRRRARGRAVGLAGAPLVPGPWPHEMLHLTACLRHHMHSAPFHHQSWVRDVSP